MNSNAGLTPRNLSLDNYKKEMMGKGYSEAEIQSWIDYLAERKDVQLKKQISIGLKSTTGPPSVQK